MMRVCIFQLRYQMPILGVVGERMRQTVGQVVSVDCIHELLGVKHTFIARHKRAWPHWVRRLSADAYTARIQT